jgi:hypothetical protein
MDLAEAIELNRRRVEEALADDGSELARFAGEPSLGSVRPDSLAVAVLSLFPREDSGIQLSATADSENFVLIRYLDDGDYRRAESPVENLDDYAGADGVRAVSERLFEALARLD